MENAMGSRDWNWGVLMLLALAGLSNAIQGCVNSRQIEKLTHELADVRKHAGAE